MKITVDGVEVLRQEYRSFDDLLNEYVDHETGRGRQVPDYDLSILLAAVGIYCLKKTFDIIVDEVRDRVRRAKEEEKTRVQGELEEKRHSEMLEKIDQLTQTLQNTARAQPPEPVPNEDTTVASALLQWARKENVSISIVLETEAEGDLREAFEALTRDLPGSSVSGAQRQLENDDST